MSAVDSFYLCGGFSIIFIITGLISLFIGIFNYKSNFIGLLTGYILILIAIMCVLFGFLNKSGDSTTALKIMNACPFIIMLMSIIYLITILTHNQDKIDNLFPPMHYYDKNSNAVLTLILIIIIYSTSVSGKFTESTTWPILDVDVPFVLLFFALWFFGYVVIIRDILLFNMTDDRNEYYTTLEEIDATNEST
jgi:hypothetical protein